MKFRKNSIWCLELFICVLLVNTISLLWFVINSKTAWPMLIASILISSLSILVLRSEWHKVVIVNEYGIQSLKSNAVEWSFGWEEIKELKKCSVYRNPGYCIILNDAPKIGLTKPHNTIDLRFQSTSRANIALKMYSPFHKIC